MRRRCSAILLALALAGCSGSRTPAAPSPSALRPTSPAASASVSPSTSASPYRVVVNPAEFSARVTNAWFPLPVGRTWEYRGVDEDGRVRELVTVSDETEVVDGVRCRVVLDRLYHGDALSETTKDLYAQDRRGDVWYFGEDTAELDEDGAMVTTEGTWHAGVAGAQPGIVMTVVPTPGESHRQEYLAGSAEDFYAVERLDATAGTPYRRFAHLLQTREWTPLEHGVVSRKLYARGLGLVQERNTTGPQETLSLVSVTDG